MARQAPHFTKQMQDLLLACVRKGYSFNQACDELSLNVNTIRRYYTLGRANPDSEWAAFAGKLDEAEQKFAFSRARAVREKLAEDILPPNALLVADSFFTPPVREAILSEIRAGVYPHVAAEHAGVPLKHFKKWLEWAETEPKGKYREFLTAFLAAKAEARASAEKRVFDENPLAWLLSSPERERGDGTGWTKQSQVKNTNVQVAVIQTKWGGADVPQISEQATSTAIEGDVTVSEENQESDAPQE